MSQRATVRPMSLPVDVAALAERISEFGDRAYLVTVADDDRPHVVSVPVVLDGDRIGVQAGRGTAANLAARAAATLLWPPVAGGGYSLIVDGEAVTPVEPGPATIRVTAAVLHRVAGVTGDAPTCLPLERT